MLDLPDMFEPTNTLHWRPVTGLSNGRASAACSRSADPKRGLPICTVLYLVPFVGVTRMLGIDRCFVAYRMSHRLILNGRFRELRHEERVRTAADQLHQREPAGHLQQAGLQQRAEAVPRGGDRRGRIHVPGQRRVPEDAMQHA